jgi:hypothetical protein
MIVAFLKADMVPPLVIRVVDALLAGVVICVSGMLWVMIFA